MKPIRSAYCAFFRLLPVLTGMLALTFLPYPGGAFAQAPDGAVVPPVISGQLTGTPLATGASIPLTYTPAGEQYQKIQNVITLSVVEESSSFLSDNFTATVTFLVDYGPDASHITTSQSETLTVNYNKATGTTYSAKNYISFKNAAYVNVRVTGVSAPTLSNGVHTLNVLLLTNEMRVRQYFQLGSGTALQPTITVAPPSTSPVPDELPVTWSWPLGANLNQTQLEWTWVETELDTMYLNPDNSINYILLFSHNSTRIDLPVGTSSYHIPLFYDGRGTLYFHLRAVNVKASGSHQEGPWSSVQAYGYQNGFLGHSDSLNWQVTTGFAEEGKRSSVMNYFDGTLRMRQSVTKDNFTNTTLSAETFYDGQGRAAIQVLPAPGINNIVKYTQNLNLFNGQSQGQDHAVFFDSQPVGTGIADTLLPMVTGTGASRYYSPANPEIATNSANGRLPDAQGYPYSVIRYTPDGSGRIASQSGEGRVLSAGKGHETKYFYGNAAQEELDGMFGTEAGLASHYSKNMVQDANGQASVTYVDMHGRTIATALAGFPATGIQSLDSTQYPGQLGNTLSRNLLSPGSNVVKNGLSVEAQTSLLVPFQTAYSFTYILPPPAVSLPSCKNGSVCYEGRYTLEITITDESGTKAPLVRRFSNTAASASSSCPATTAPLLDLHYDPSETSTVSGNAISFTDILPGGSYTIRKTLTVDDSTRQLLRSQYLQVGLCDTTLQQVIDSVKNLLVPASPCGTPHSTVAPCVACINALGAYPTFRTNYLAGLDTINNKPPETEIHQAYSRDSSQCASLCDTTSHRLDIMRQIMLADMMPYTGQYAKNPDSVLSKGTMYNKYNIFSPGGFASQPFYQNPQSGHYFDATGAVDQSIPAAGSGLQNVSVKRFDSLFVPPWASSLLPYHPEYSRLQFATQHLQHAYDWIEQFNQTSGYGSAQTTGYNNSGGTIETIDPFFSVASGYGSTMNNIETVSWYGNSSLWQLAYSNVACPSYSDATTRNNCYANAPKHPPFSGLTNDQLDEVWSVFKGLYGSVRDSLVNDYIQKSVALADTGSLVGQGYILRFAATTSQQASQYQWTGFPTTPGAAPTVSTSTQTAADKTSRCSSYIDHWKELLLQCPALASASNKDQILTEMTVAMEAVCEKGLDESNPYGASNVSPSTPRDGSDTSFEQAIARVFANHFISKDQFCNPYAIDYPKPYSKGPVFTKEVTSTVDSCACSQFAKISSAATQAGYNPSNLASLNQYLLQTYQDTLTTVLFNGLQHCSVIGTVVGDCAPAWLVSKGICSPSLKAACVNPTGSVITSTTTSVAQGVTGGGAIACNSTDTCTVVYSGQQCDTIRVYALDSPQPKPAFLECGFAGTGRCLTCAQLSAYVSSYKQYFTGIACSTAPVFGSSEPSDTVVGYNAAFARYVNYKSGLQLGWTDYVNNAAATGCNLNNYASNSGATQTVVCGSSKPLNDTTGVLTVQSPCQQVYNMAVDMATAIYTQRKQRLLANFDSTYLAACLSAKNVEQFRVQYNVREYHYTLYYYDRAGNLVKTVPPKGAMPNFSSSFVSSVELARGTGAVMPPHQLATDYRYNSLNKVITAHSPDAGIANFWYDRIGRLVVSQNAQQAADGKFSYTVYDPVGRIIELGRTRQGTAMVQTISKDTAQLSNWIFGSGSTREQITGTVYDIGAVFGTNPLLTQQNLRNRVSYMFTKNLATDASWYTVTYYTYDTHGDVDTLLQDYTGVVAMNGTNNRYKRICYDYDLISGKVNGVDYQPGSYDAFYHRYHYDAENRLINVQTSRDSIVWERDAAYSYYKHRALSTTQIGMLNVQQQDYSYTLQGWLKGIGIGKWGSTGAANSGGTTTAGLTQAYPVAQDAYTYSLHYFVGDYNSAGSGTNGTHTTSILEALPASSLYNGNIAAMTVGIPLLGSPRVYNYHYDQLNRLVNMDAFKGIDTVAGTFTPTLLDDYKERVTYDPNGNILSYLRHGYSDGSHQAPMDSLVYHYVSGRNQLNYLDDGVAVNSYTTDVKGQSAGNYTYDQNGNLIKDNAEGLNSITWNVYGKILEIQRTATGSNTTTDLLYTYDAAGNRITKMVNNSSTTVYVRDASGNVVSVYLQNAGGGALQQVETHLYGGSRLGMARALTVAPQSITLTGGLAATVYTFTRGEKSYELSNHLGNVLAVLTDRKNAVFSSGNSSLTDHYTADVANAQDYYPFGMQMPGRSYTGVPNYRYGFNGKENDNEAKGAGDQIDYGMRVYDPRVGRFMSVDPLTPKYPFYTPYQFAGNKPVWAVDVDGLEEAPTTKGSEEAQPQTQKAWITGPRGIGYENKITYYWHGGGLTTGRNQKNADGSWSPKLSQAGWYTGEEYLDLLKSSGAATALASMMHLYANGATPNNVNNEELFKFIGAGLHGDATKFLLGAAQANANARNFYVSGVIYPSSFNVEDMLGVGLIFKEGVELLGALTARNILEQSSFKVLSPDIYVKVGHWSTKESYNLMKTTGRVVEEVDGRTFFSINGPASWSAAPKGWVYSEFEVRANSLVPAGNWDWWQAIHPNGTGYLQQKVLNQGGQLTPGLRNLSPILQTK